MRPLAVGVIFLAACSRHPERAAILPDVDADPKSTDATADAVDVAESASALTWYFDDGRPNLPERRGTNAALGPFAAPWQVCELALESCDPQSEDCTCDFRWEETVPGGRVRQTGWVRVPHGEHLAVRTALGCWVERAGLLRGREWAGNGDGWWTYEVTARSARGTGKDVDASARIESKVCTCCGGCRNATPSGGTYYGKTLSDDHASDAFVRCRVDEDDRPRCAVVVAYAGFHAPPLPRSVIRPIADDRVVVENLAKKGDFSEYSLGL